MSSPYMTDDSGVAMRVTDPCLRGFRIQFDSRWFTQASLVAPNGSILAQRQLNLSQPQEWRNITAPVTLPPNRTYLVVAYAGGDWYCPRYDDIDQASRKRPILTSRVVDGMIAAGQMPRSESLVFSLLSGRVRKLRQALRACLHPPQRRHPVRHPHPASVETLRPEEIPHWKSDDDSGLKQLATIALLLIAVTVMRKSRDRRSTCK
jgi:hypothetical protein